MDLLEQHNGELNGPVRYPTLQSKRRAEDGVPESLFGKCPCSCESKHPALQF